MALDNSLATKRSLIRELLLQDLGFALPASRNNLLQRVNLGKYDDSLQVLYVDLLGEGLTSAETVLAPLCNRFGEVLDAKRQRQRPSEPWLAATPSPPLVPPPQPILNMAPPMALEAARNSRRELIRDLLVHRLVFTFEVSRNNLLQQMNLGKYDESLQGLYADLLDQGILSAETVLAPLCNRFGEVLDGKRQRNRQSEPMPSVVPSPSLPRMPFQPRRIPDAAAFLQVPPPPQLVPVTVVPRPILTTAAPTQPVLATVVPSQQRTIFDASTSMASEDALSLRRDLVRDFLVHGLVFRLDVSRINLLGRVDLGKYDESLQVLYVDLLGEGITDAETALAPLCNRFGEVMDAKRQRNRPSEPTPSPVLASAPVPPSPPISVVPAISNEERILRRMLICDLLSNDLVFASAVSRINLLGRVNLGKYDESLKSLYADLLGEGVVDAETFLTSLSNHFGEVVEAKRQRNRPMELPQPPQPPPPPAPPVVRLAPVRQSAVTASHSKATSASRFTSPFLKKAKRSELCTICFQSPADEWCDICGVGAHFHCGNFVGNECDSDRNKAPFRIDADILNAKACGFCRSTRKAREKGATNMSSFDEVECEVCKVKKMNAMLTYSVRGIQANKWSHICCARFMPGSAITNHGAKTFVLQSDACLRPCSICQSNEGVTTWCLGCGDSAPAVHVSCALKLGKYGLMAAEPNSAVQRIVCKKHTPHDVVHVMAASAAPTHHVQQYVPPQFNYQSPGLPLSREVTTVNLFPASNLPKSYPEQILLNRCGACLRMFEHSSRRQTCDGCDVEMHKECCHDDFKETTSSQFTDTDSQQLFFKPPSVGHRPFLCRACTTPKFRGRAPICAICPHRSYQLGGFSIEMTEFDSSDFVHAICVRFTEDLLAVNKRPVPAVMETFNSPDVDISFGLEGPACRFCFETEGRLLVCPSCEERFHGLCAALVSNDADSLISGARVLSSCEHCSKHVEKLLSPLMTTYAVGTGLCSVRRPISGIFGFARQCLVEGKDMQAIASDLLGLKTEGELAAMLDQSQVYPSLLPEASLTASDHVLRTAISRAWSRTKMDCVKKRLSKNRSSGARWRSSTTTSEAGLKRAFGLDEPIEVCEVWPLIEPYFKIPGNTSLFERTLHCERVCDPAMLSQNENDFPVATLSRTTKLDVLVNVMRLNNPFLPASCDSLLPLLRPMVSSNVPFGRCRFAVTKDLAVLANMDVCLGANQHFSDLDAHSKYELGRAMLGRAMTSENHMLLISDDAGSAVHCAYFELDADGNRQMRSGIAFIRVSSTMASDAAALLALCIKSDLTPVSLNGRDCNTVYVTFVHDTLFEFFRTQFKAANVDTAYFTRTIRFECNVAYNVGMIANQMLMLGNLARAVSFPRPELIWNPARLPEQGALRMTAQIFVKGEAGGGSGNLLEMKPMGQSVFSCTIAKDSTRADMIWDGFDAVDVGAASLSLQDPTVLDLVSSRSSIDDPDLIAARLQSALKELNKARVFNDNALTMIKSRIRISQERVRVINKHNITFEETFKQRRIAMSALRDGIVTRFEEEINATCAICGSGDSPAGNEILICENGDHYAAHLKCLGLAKVPEGCWYCSQCSQRGHGYNAALASPVLEKPAVSRKNAAVANAKSSPPIAFQQPSPQQQLQQQAFIIPQNYSDMVQHYPYMMQRYPVGMPQYPMALSPFPAVMPRSHGMIPHLPAVMPHLPSVMHSSPVLARPPTVAMQPTPVVARPQPPVIQPTPAMARVFAPHLPPAVIPRLSTMMRSSPTVMQPALTVMQPASTVMQPGLTVMQPALTVMQPSPATARPPPTKMSPSPVAMPTSPVGPRAMGISNAQPKVSSPLAAAPPPPPPPPVSPPISKRPATVMTTTSAQDEFLCICNGKYDDEEFMLGCDSCENWYHPQCIGMSMCQMHSDCVIFNRNHMQVSECSFKCGKCAKRGVFVLVRRTKKPANRSGQRKRPRVYDDDDDEDVGEDDDAAVEDDYDEDMSDDGDVFAPGSRSGSRSGRRSGSRKRGPDHRKRSGMRRKPSERVAAVVATASFKETTGIYSGIVAEGEEEIILEDDEEAV